MSRIGSLKPTCRPFSRTTTGTSSLRALLSTWGFGVRCSPGQACSTHLNALDIDTAGQEDFDRLRSLSYNDTDLVLIVFSIDAPTSLANVSSKWVPEIQHHCEGVPFLLVGTKSDLRNDEQTLEKLRARNQKVVELSDANAVGKEIGAQAILECSALTGAGIKEVFDQALKVVLVKKGLLKTEKPQSTSCCTLM